MRYGAIQISLFLSTLATPGTLFLSQTVSATKPLFEVASIKLWLPGSPMHFDECSGDRYNKAAIPLSTREARADPARRQYPSP
jgi:hypothetical protein